MYLSLPRNRPWISWHQARKWQRGSCQCSRSLCRTQHRPHKLGRPTGLRIKKGLRFDITCCFLVPRCSNHCLSQPLSTQFPPMPPRWYSGGISLPRAVHLTAPHSSSPKRIFRQWQHLLRFDRTSQHLYIYSREWLFLPLATNGLSPSTSQISFRTHDHTKCLLKVAISPPISRNSEAFHYIYQS